MSRTQMIADLERLFEELPEEKKEALIHRILLHSNDLDLMSIHEEWMGVRP